MQQNIREHISIEHQLKIQCEKYAEKLDLLEEEKIILLSQIVRIIFIYALYYIFYILGWWKKRIQRTIRRFNKTNW